MRRETGTFYLFLAKIFDFPSERNNFLFSQLSSLVTFF